MIYVLIAIATLAGYSSGVSSITFQEFSSKEKCEAVVKQLKNNSRIDVFCVEK